MLLTVIETEISIRFYAAFAERLNNFQKINISHLIRSSSRTSALSCRAGWCSPVTRRAMMARVGPSMQKCEIAETRRSVVPGTPGRCLDVGMNNIT